MFLYILGMNQNGQGISQTDHGIITHFDVLMRNLPSGIRLKITIYSLKKKLPYQRNIHITPILAVSTDPGEML